MKKNKRHNNRIGITVTKDDKSKGDEMDERKATTIIWPREARNSWWKKTEDTIRGFGVTKFNKYGKKSPAK